MLKIHFINVAEGDAILIERLVEGEPGYRVLVDDGRPDVEPTEGSRCMMAGSYLQANGIGRIDDLIISHLHIDHFGGTSDLLGKVDIGTVYASYIPADLNLRITVDPQLDKAIRGLYECLDMWADDVAALQAKGTALVPIDQDTVLPTPDGLRMRVICPSDMAAQAQQLIYDRLFAGEAVSDKSRFWAAKARNGNSLRVEMTYAGRRVALTADCYGRFWDQGELKPCDILKVPHHGDAKSLTPLLAAKLHPTYAVVTCGKDYIAHKDRPSHDMIQLLRQQGTTVYYTDAFAEAGQTANDWTAAVFTIQDDGTIIPPQQGANQKEKADRQI